MSAKIERYEGIDIWKHPQWGFYAEHGFESFGYHAELDAIREEIDDYWQSAEHGEANGFFAELF